MWLGGEDRGVTAELGARRRGSEMAVALGELVGGDGCVRASEREEAEERNEGEGESEGVQGVGAAPRR